MVFAASWERTREQLPLLTNVKEHNLRRRPACSIEDGGRHIVGCVNEGAWSGERQCSDTGARG